MENASARREEDWRQVRQYLRRDPNVDRERLGKYESYFFTGEPEPPGLIERLWLHPDGLRSWNAILAHATPSDFINARGSLRTYCEGERFAASNGALGHSGRALIKIFFPPASDGFVRFKGKSWEATAGLGAWSSSWLTAERAAPYSIDQYTEELFWRLIPTDAQVELALRENAEADELDHIPPEWRALGESYLSEYRYLCQIANYVEPRGLPGEDTPQRRHAERMHRDFTERAAANKLPKYLGVWWEDMQTRECRGRVWTDLPSEYAEDDDNVYEVLAAHGNPANARISDVVRVLAKLGFADAYFDGRRVDQISLEKHLDPRFAKRLGYKKGQKIPGYRYRIETNAEYTDATTARVHLDVVVPVLAPGHDEADSPSLVVIPRPDKPYAVSEAITWQLNHRMLRRVYEERTGVPLTVYRDSNRWDTYPFHWGDFFDAKYTPNRPKVNAFPNDKRSDFPKWSGKSLPRLTE